MEEETKRTEPEQPAQLEEQAEPKEDFQTLIRGKYRAEYLRHAASLLAAQAEEQRRYGQYREIRRQAETLKAEHPEFDLNRELEDPGFAGLLRSGVDLRVAWEAVHHAELARSRESRSASEAQPMENALQSQAAILRADPRKLTRQERRQLRRRAARGEEIVW